MQPHSVLSRMQNVPFHCLFQNIYIYFLNCKTVSKYLTNEITPRRKATLCELVDRFSNNYKEVKHTIFASAKYWKMEIRVWSKRIPRRVLDYNTWANLSGFFHAVGRERTTHLLPEMSAPALREANRNNRYPYTGSGSWFFFFFKRRTVEVCLTVALPLQIHRTVEWMRGGLEG